MTNYGFAAVVRRHQDAYPVQTVPIANDLGLKVYRVPNWDANTSGVIKRDAADGGTSGYAIYVNEKHPEVRRRFTIAHEIGHFCLHKDLIGDGIVEDALWRADNLSNKIEAQANRFAANLLMPWHLIERANDNGVVDIRDLARAFNVSKDAMSIRLYNAPYEQVVGNQMPADVLPVLRT